MKKILMAFSVLVLLISSVEAGEFITADRPLPGRYVVIFKPEAVRSPMALATAPGRTVSQLVSDFALVYGGVAEKTFQNAVQGGVIATTRERARALALDPRVAFVEEDHEIRMFATDLTLGPWWVDRLDERDRPLNNHFTYTRNGAGVNIYIIDTGVDFSYGYWTGRGFNAYSNVRDGSGNMIFGDTDGHGSTVAIHAAASGWGVARGANLQAVRVRTIPCSTTGMGHGDIPAYSGACFTLTDLVDAINWVAGHRVLPAVANMSFGGGGSPTLDAAATGLINSGVTVVAAAGNSNASACDVSPARVPAVITVGATNSSDVRSSFSNFGSCVDLFAPGENVYNGANGTSFSSPIVAGVAAQYLQGTPSASPSAVQTYLINNATTGRVSNAGAGSPNRLVFSPPGGTEIDNPPVANFNFSCSGRTCTFTSTSTDDFATGYCSWDWGHAYDFQPREGCSLSHTFPAGGGYSVTLSVNDDAWQPASKVRIVTVN
jgi:subtilisin family serine protease